MAVSCILGYDCTVRAPSDAVHRESGAAVAPLRGDAESGFAP